MMGFGTSCLEKVDPVRNRLFYLQKCSGNVYRQLKYWEMQQIMRETENTKFIS